VNGAVISSSSFRITVGSLGDTLPARGLSGASYSMSPSWQAAYSPPGEVTALRFADLDTLGWDAEPSAGSYNIYRDPLGLLPGTYGACHLQGLASLSVGDAAVPPPSEAFFYLVTVENRLREEGTKGRRSDGTLRGGTMCP